MAYMMYLELDVTMQARGSTFAHYLVSLQAQSCAVSAGAAL